MKNLNRERLGNPFSQQPLSERRKQKGSINLHNNIQVEDKGNGFWVIKPLNAKNTF